MTFTPAPVHMDVEISRIDTTGGTQMRCRIDDATVIDYRDRILAGDDMPPIVVYRDGSKHWLADGFHRYRAMVSIGARSILCEVHVGDRTDAIIYAVGANKTNGLRRTNADKQMAIRAALSIERLAGLSNRALADLIGVDDKTVNSMRCAPGAEIPQLDANRVKGRDGKSYPSPKSKTPRAATRGPDRHTSPHGSTEMNLADGAESVNEEKGGADGAHGARPEAKKRAALARGESILCPHCGGTGRVRGD